MNKIARVNAIFWIMKICAITLGCMAGERLSMFLNAGWAVKSLVLIGIFLISLVAQLRARSFHPVLFWSVVLSIGAVGATVSDFIGTFGPGDANAALILSAALVGVLTAWRVSEKTLSLKRMHRPGAEMFYWAAIVVSNILGGAVGNYLTGSSHLGFSGAAAMMGGLLMVILFIFCFTRWSRTVLFWIAFVFTRPFGDLLTKPVGKGGLDSGTIGFSAILACLLAGLVIYTLRKEKGMMVASCGSFKPVA
ncbi:MAG: hypothetical protein ABI162_19165 [Luteolibacter sp.]